MDNWHELRLFYAYTKTRCGSKTCVFSWYKTEL